MPLPSPEASLKQIDESLLPMIAALSKDEPCGKDPRRNEVFLELQEAATAVTRPNGAPTDWTRLQTKAEQLLQTQSKDLRVASYLGLAYVQDSSLEGLARGLRLLSKLLTDYPETLFPNKRGSSDPSRLRALDWYLEYITRRNKTRGFKGTASQAKLAKECAHEFAEVCEGMFGKDSLRLGDLSAMLRSIQIQERTQPTKPSSPSPRSETIERPQSEPWQDAWDSLRVHAHQLREADPRNPLSYRMLRGALWTGLSRAPQADAAGRCQVSLPTEQDRHALQGHFAAQRWKGLLETAENLLAKYVLCLDLHLYTVQALQALGDSDEAVRSIETVLIELLSRMPELLELKGANGAPLASPPTRLWIKDLISVPTGPQADSSREVSLEKEPWWQAIAAKSSTQRADTLRLLQEALEQSPDRITYAQRALFAARKLGSIHGLAPVLAGLARRTLREPHAMVVCKSLEQQCWALLPMGSGRADSPFGDTPSMSPDLLDLAQVNLPAAIERLGKSTPI